MPAPINAARPTVGRFQNLSAHSTMSAEVSTYALSDISISSLIQRCAYTAAPAAANRPTRSSATSRPTRPITKIAAPPRTHDARRWVSSLWPMKRETAGEVQEVDGRMAGARCDAAERAVLGPDR